MRKMFCKMCGFDDQQHMEDYIAWDHEYCLHRDIHRRLGQVQRDSSGKISCDMSHSALLKKAREVQGQLDDATLAMCASMEKYRKLNKFSHIMFDDCIKFLKKQDGMSND